MEDIISVVHPKDDTRYINLTKQQHSLIPIIRRKLSPTRVDPLSDYEAAKIAQNFGVIWDALNEAVYVMTSVMGPLSYQYTTKLNHTVKYDVEAL